MYLKYDPTLALGILSTIVAFKLFKSQFTVRNILHYNPGVCTCEHENFLKQY